MNLNIENLVRSGVALAVGLPLALSVGGAVGTASDLVANAAAKAQEKTEMEVLRASLETPCVKYAMSKSDSKLEREAKNDLDDALGGEVSHGNLCQWVMN